MVAQNNIVGEVGLKVVPVDPAAQFQAGVDQIIKRLEKQAQFQIKASGLENVERQANVAAEAFANAAIQAAGLTAAIYGIKASVEGAINKLSGLFDQLAQARAGFTSILHSEAAGGALLNDIREFARVSPFVTQELVNYSQQLLGVGLSAEKIIPLLKSTGDIISSVGGDTQNLGRVLFTLTQIKSIGALKGQDTMQLQNSLIPITKYLSDYLHKSSQEIVKLREDGKITADTVFAALNAQGEKVKGAMDRATRNIAGARAILSDTVTQLFQNQPVLNKVFEDVYKSIAKFADKLSSTEFQQAFAQFFDGVERFYESLKPILEQIGKLADSQGINALKLFGTTIGAFGTALSAIPEGVMNLLVRTFVALATLKAPLLLLQYVSSIRTMASSIIPATTNLARMGAAQAVAAEQSVYATAVYKNEVVALDQMTAALTANQRAQLGQQFATQQSKGPGFFSRNAGRIGTGVAIGGQVAGQYLSSKSGTGAKTAGGLLQGASTGALIGSVIGPEGAIAGAAIGAAIGGITAFFGEKDRKIKEDIEKMKVLGKQDAEAFITEVGKKFGDSASGEGFLAYQAKIRDLSHEYQTQAAKIAEINNNLPDGFGDLAAKPTKEMEGLKAQIDALASESAAQFDPLREGLKNLVAGLDKSEAGFLALTTVARGGVRVAATNLNQADEALAKYGFTLADLNIPEKQEQMVQYIRTWDGLTTAQQKATAEANKYNTALDTAKANAASVFDPQEKRIQSQIDFAGVRAEAEKAALDFTGANNALNFKLLAMKEQEAKQSEREAYYLGLGYAATTATYRARVDGETELNRLNAERRAGQNSKSARDRLQGVNEADVSNSPFARDINGEIKKREDDIKKWKEEADKAAKKAAEEALAFAQKVKSAGSSLADKLQSASDAIASAAERWVGSIKERTQYEKAVSAGTAIKNTERQIRDLTELTSGLNELRARGLTDDAIKALGIDNVNDVKQVRKLLKANPGDLSRLSSDVSSLNAKATDLATSAENKRTQDNIRDGILAAADTLGIDLTKPAAAAIASTFNITTTTDADAVAQAILYALSGGKVGR